MNDLRSEDSLELRRNLRRREHPGSNVWVDLDDGADPHPVACWEGRAKELIELSNDFLSELIVIELLSNKVHVEASVFELGLHVLFDDLRTVLDQNLGVLHLRHFLERVQLVEVEILCSH